MFERERELAAIDGATRGARSGRGAILAFRGPSGIGISALLDAATAQGRDRGLLTLGNSASEFDPEPLGVVLGLLGEPNAGPGTGPGPRLLAATPADRFAVVEHLFAALGRLTDQRPALITIDDAQWLDETSLALLRRVAIEIEDLSLCITLGLREADPGAERVLAAITGLAGIEVLVPAPLGISGVAGLAEARAGRARPALTRPLLSRSGGNPRQLVALLDALDAAGATGDDDPDLVATLLPEPATARVAAQLERCSADARTLAAAIAVAGGGVGERALARICGLGPAETGAAAEELRGAGLVGTARALDFESPLIRRAVLEVTSASLQPIRESAAQALFDAGLPIRAAALIRSLGSRPAGSDDWAVGCLIEAADESARRGAVEEALACLKPALEPPPPPELRTAALIARGTILSRRRDPDAIADLEAALELATDPGTRGRVALALSQACFHLVRLEEAAAIARSVAGELEGVEPELRLELEAAALDADRLRGTGRAAARSLEAEVRDGATPGERAALAHVAAEAVARGARPAEEIAKLAEACWAGGKLLAEKPADAPVVSFAGTTLAWCERFEAALELAEAQLASGRAAHTPVTASYALALRSGIRLRLGQLAQAEADAEAVVSQLPASDPLAHMICFGWLLEAMVGRGRVEEAADRLHASSLDGELPDLGTTDFLLLSRGDVLLASGNAADALREYEEAGARAERSGFLNPAGIGWRSRAVPALLELGRADEAAALAREELERAERFGAPRALAVALGAAAACAESGSERRLELLRRGLEALESSPARLERARLQVALGLTLLHRGDDEAAISRLREGMDNAHRCGAEPLVDEAMDGLRAAGKRPRRPAIRGVDALTSQQLRVAQLAAAGRSNPEIAEVLFLSRRAVELHLTGAYRKLGISSREELAGALAGEPEPVAPSL